MKILGFFFPTKIKCINSKEPPLTVSRTLVSQFSCSVISDSETPWTAARQASLSITNSQSLLKLMSIVSVMPSNQLILCRPLLLTFNLSKHKGLTHVHCISDAIQSTHPLSSPSPRLQSFPASGSFPMSWLF